MLEASAQARQRGFLTKAEFLKITDWKSRRIHSRCASNSSQLVEEITRISLAAGAEEIRIDVLTLLFGVGYPTASALLHLTHPDPYPILDYRALWSLGLERLPKYTFDFWQEYTLACRDLAEENGLSMRRLDRALWQYSKENQAA